MTRFGERRRLGDVHFILRLATLVVILAVIPGCERSGSTKTTTPLPQGPPQVLVTMTEFAYQFNPNIPRGRVVFNVRNVGEKRHELILAPQPEDYPPIDEQVRGKVSRILLTMYYKRAIPPGTSDAFAVDLTPGRYAMICFIPDTDDKLHALKGMTAEFVVPEATPNNGGS